MNTNHRPTIVLGGGGSGGHIAPLIALAELLREAEWNVHFIVSTSAVDRDIVRSSEMPYFSVAAAKLRRDRPFGTMYAPAIALRGAAQAYSLLRRLAPNVVLTSGGYVSVPVALAARASSIPLAVYECDATPGLATKVCSRLARRVLCAFESATAALPPGARPVGPFLRANVRRAAARRLEDRHELRELKSLVVFGGSLGSAAINDAVRRSLAQLTQTLRIIHVCGPGKLNADIQAPNYQQVEYAPNLPELLANADIAIGRGGANSLWELVALRVPHIVVPLSRRVSRGDQLNNARFFEQRGATKVIQEEALSSELLVKTIAEVLRNSDRYVRAMETFRCDAAPLLEAKRVLGELFS